MWRSSSLPTAFSSIELSTPRASRSSLSAIRESAAELHPAVSIERSAAHKQTKSAKKSERQSKRASFDADSPGQMFSNPLQAIIEFPRRVHSAFEDLDLLDDMQHELRADSAPAPLSRAELEHTRPHTLDVNEFTSVRESPHYETIELLHDFYQSHLEHIAVNGNASRAIGVTDLALQRTALPSLAKIAKITEMQRLTNSHDPAELKTLAGLLEQAQWQHLARLVNTGAMPTPADRNRIAATLQRAAYDADQSHVRELGRVHQKLDAATNFEANAGTLNAHSIALERQSLMNALDDLTLLEKRTLRGGKAQLAARLTRAKMRIPAAIDEAPALRTKLLEAFDTRLLTIS